MLGRYSNNTLFWRCVDRLSHCDTQFACPDMALLAIGGAMDLEPSTVLYPAEPSARIRFAYYWWDELMNA